MAESVPELPPDAQFETILEGSDLLPMVLRAHQAIEAALNLAIAESLPAPHAMEIERLSTALKIDIAVALHIVPADDAPALRKINGLRNVLAHDPRAAFTPHDAKALFNALSARQRHLIGRGYDEFSEHIEVLRHVLAVLYVDLASTLDRLRDAKLRDEVLHEMVRDRIRRPPRPDDPGTLRIEAEIQARMEAKKRGGKSRAGGCADDTSEQPGRSVTQ